MSTTVSREFIAFGPKESFVFPIPASFVSERESFGVGEAKISQPVRIDHSTGFSPGVAVIWKDNGGAASYTLTWQPLVSSDGIDGATGGYKNAVWGPAVSLHAGAAATVAIYQLAVAPAETILPTQAIRLTITNSGAAITAVAPNPFVPGDLGTGVQVRVMVRSQP